MAQDILFPILRNGKLETATADEMRAYLAGPGVIDQPSTGPVVVPNPVVEPEPGKLLARATEPVVLTVGQAVSYRIPDAAFIGPVEHVDVSDLPAGLRYDSATRTISGTPVTPGKRTLTVTATGSGQLAQTDLLLTIDPAGGEVKQPDTVRPVDTETTGWQYTNHTL